MKATIYSIARKSIFLILPLTIVFASGASYAQTKVAPPAIYNPCKDSLYLLLKDAPPVSLNESERRYVEQKAKECREYLTGKIEEQKPLPVKSVQEKQAVQQVDVIAGEKGSQEEFLTIRNVGIMTAIVGAVVGLAIALGSVTKAPF